MLLIILFRSPFVVFIRDSGIPKTRLRDLRAAMRNVGKDFPFIQVPPGGEFSNPRCNRLLRALAKSLKIPADKVEGWWVKYRKSIYQVHRDLFNKIASRARKVLRNEAVELFGAKPNDGDEPEDKVIWLRNAREVIKKFKTRNGNIEVRSGRTEVASIEDPSCLVFVSKSLLLCVMSYRCGALLTTLRGPPTASI